ncbi:hypothetical protein NIES2119_27330 [[Phormidium ambiguum] IAM M-71]|uniref:DUF6671 domain-containing protein n=1 Tax=[Phormidium ambiguum] IAM M-71 TaxID=454136 RepID=A0A1U7I6U8_9CYAN|nr:DUF6671 family protein [Phormidium ambiguum]OKH32073.1 hypothetical protein NIES2119_27330 [Phormidium ambiguum IAM M-71]
MNSGSLFVDRIAVIATMHKKEEAIAPILAKELGIKAIVPSTFDSDKFGTFTREIKRLGTQIEAAKIKAEQALNITGETLAISSEGTFGPHPFVPYLSCNREIVMLLDKKHDIEIIGEEFSTETNHSHQVVKSVEAAFEFAQKVGFPEHGLVVMFEETPKDNSEIIKGITTPEKLEEAVSLFLKKSSNGKVHLETDMRALYNPTRMKNIAKATLNLVEKINSLCPKCDYPGFSLTERKRGLPCALCNMPTQLTLSAIYQCQKCGFQKEILFPDGIEQVDPAQCMYCNP